MTVTNKTKTNISPINLSKGIGAEWADLVATWADTVFGWADTVVFTNKTKSSITPDNKTKNNI